MKKLLIISFDIIRENEPNFPYNIASLISHLTDQKEFNETFKLQTISINLFNQHSYLPNWENYSEITKATHIAIGCNIWSEVQCLSLMKWIKTLNPEIKIIAGGYSISNDLCDNKSRYPNADYFIYGAGEEALEQIILKKGNLQLYSNFKTNDFKLPFIYSNKTIVLENGKNLRWETKRNCPFRCSFCSYQSGIGRKLQAQEKERLAIEWKAIANSKPQRINITDPVFNIKGNYINAIEVMCEEQTNATINMQIRPEFLADEKDEGVYKLMEFAQQSNVQFELGIQTLQKIEMDLINRKNEIQKIERAFKLLKQFNVQFGISLIYGLPGQTIDSFINTIKKIQDIGPSEIVAYPLMLLPGTELYKNKNSMGLIESKIGDYGLSYVIESPSFKYSEYLEMEEISKNLNPNYRLF
jgi:radical SAM superfamily enzyme YgiQ (UPF0313 family)